MIKNRLHHFSNINSLFNYSETLQGLRHAAVLAHAGALARLPSSPTHLSLGHLRGLSCVADHVRSWGWRPCNANPPPRLRKVPFLPAQNENNKEPSVAAASGAQRTHQNMSKSHSLLLALTHPSMRDSSSLKRTILQHLRPFFEPTEDTHGFILTPTIPPLLTVYQEF